MFTRAFSRRAQPSPSAAPRFAVPAPSLVPQRIQAPLPAAPSRTNRTGMPDQLKAGIESLSGMSMDHVKVHYNSSRPAQLNALAYARGADIHVAPGQEHQLPHEAWHLIQQAQGRVKPTMQAKGTRINDDPDLESEADKMGWKALHEAPALPEQNQQSFYGGRMLPPALCGNDATAQLKPATFMLKTGIKPLKGEVKKGTAQIEYDDEAGISVEGIKSQLAQKHAGLYVITINWIGTNPERDGNLKRDEFVVSAELLRLSSTRDNLVAIMIEQETQEEKEMEEAPKRRPEDVVKKSELRSLIEEYGFQKIVTGNHIDGAREYTGKVNEGVVDQQINEMNGRTLFIDALFGRPEEEGQYHDILARQGADVSFPRPNFCIVQTPETFLGILSKKMYSNELNDLAELLRVIVRHYINETRPGNILEE